MSFTCAVCGGTHSGETRDIRAGLPEPIFLLDNEERGRRAYVEDDFALLRSEKGDRYFVRALLELAIDGEDGCFRYGAWVEVTETDVAAIGELWNEETGEEASLFRGSLANELSPYAFTEGLPVQIRLGDVDLLPTVELDDSDHELVRAQRNGISSHRAHELAATVQ